MTGEKMLISEETEEKRLRDFKRIVENWDALPEYARGKLDGTISAFSTIYLNGCAEQK